MCNPGATADEEETEGPLKAPEANTALGLRWAEGALGRPKMPLAGDQGSGFLRAAGLRQRSQINEHFTAEWNNSLPSSRHI